MMCLSNEIYRLKIVKKKEKIACELFRKEKDKKKKEEKLPTRKRRFLSFCLVLYKTTHYVAN